MKLIKNIFIFAIAFSIIVIPNNYSGVINEVYGDAIEINGLGDYEGALVWYDDFNGNSLDTSKWNNEGATGAGGYGNKELQDYEINYCEVKDGNLIIKPQFQYNALEDRNVPDSYYSTKLWTKNQFNFKYGRIEIRAKLPKGQGTNATGWMCGNGSNGKWPDCGEIDLFDTMNESTKTKIVQSIHCKRFNGMITSEGQKHWDSVIDTATSAYHTYGAIWNDKKITFTVDGVISGTYDPSQYTLSGDGTDDITIWPFNNSQYLVLQCAIGGTLGGNVTTDGWTMIDKSGDIETYQDKMYIDSVKVYKTKQDSSGETTTNVETTTSAETTKNIETTNNTSNNNIITNSKKTSIKSIKAKKKSLKISWKKVAGVNGYQLQYGSKKTMKDAKTVNINKATVSSKTIKNLKKKKKYYVRIRTFILNNGVSVYSPWSAKKAKKTK